MYLYTMRAQTTNPFSFGYTFERKSTDKIEGLGAAQDGRTVEPVTCDGVTAGRTTLCEVEENLISDLQMLHAQEFYQRFVENKK